MLTPGQRVRALAAAVPVLAGLAGWILAGPGCASDMRAVPVEERRAKFQADPDAYAALGYRLDWRGFPAVGGGQSVQCIQAYPDVVTVLETGSTASALEADNGGTRWTNALANPLTRFTGIARQANMVLVCSQADVFILDTQTGRQADRQTFASVVATPPVLFNNLLIFGTGRGELFAHALNVVGVHGVKAWGTMLRGSVARKPVLIGPVVGAVSDGGDIAFCDAQSGQLVGRNRIFDTLSGAVAADPAANDELMFVASLDQSLYAFSTAGSLVWRYRTGAPLRRTPTAVGPTLYCAIDGQGLVAFQADTGRIRWTAPGVDGTVIGTRKGRLLVWDGATMTTLDPERGDPFDRVKLPGVAALAPDRFDDGNLYVASPEGVVAKFTPR